MAFTKARSVCRTPTCFLPHQFIRACDRCSRARMEGEGGQVRACIVQKFRHNALARNVVPRMVRGGAIRPIGSSSMWGKFGGLTENRTRVRGFAVRYVTTPPSGRRRLLAGEGGSLTERPALGNLS